MVPGYQEIGGEREMDPYLPATGYNSGYGGYSPYSTMPGGAPSVSLEGAPSVSLEGTPSVTLLPTQLPTQQYSTNYGQLPRPSTPPSPTLGLPGISTPAPLTLPAPLPLNTNQLQSGIGIGPGSKPIDSGLGLGGMISPTLGGGANLTGLNTGGLSLGGMASPTPRLSKLALPKLNNTFLQPTTQNSVTASMSVYQRLDMVTRSRNALILAVIFLSIFFLAAFIAALILAFPDTLIQSIEITVKSTRTDFTYNEADLGSSSSFRFTVMQTTFCNQLVPIATSVASINKCYVERFQNAEPGVIGYAVLDTALRGSKAEDVARSVGEAIVRSAATNPVWNVGANDISVRVPGFSAASVIDTIQLPLLLVFLWLLHRML